MVDSSYDDRTKVVCARFENMLSDFKYLRNESGIGRMTTSRNIALLHSTGDIVSFIDDDSYAHPSWAEVVISTFSDGSIKAVAGHVIGDVADDSLPVGIIDPNGNVVGNFGRNLESPVDVEHAMGCNMSFRHTVLSELSGFRTDYPGISGIREDTDIFLRLKALGHRVVFQPHASVRHIGAPQLTGRRFDLSYTYAASRNHAVLMIRNRRYLRGKAFRYFITKPFVSLNTLARKIVSAFAYAIAEATGTVAGIVQSVRKN